jgi:membrane protein required for colicin V production
MLGYDLFMLVIFLAATMHGAWRGMVWQIAPIVSLVVAYVVALPLSYQLAPWFGSQAPTNQYVAMLVLYLVVSLVVFVSAGLLKGLLSEIRLDEYDRHLGSLLGAVKGLLACVAITLFSVMLWDEVRAPILESHSGYAAAVVMDRLHPIMPPKIRDLLEPYIHQLDHSAQARGDRLPHNYPNRPVAANQTSAATPPPHTSTAVGTLPSPVRLSTEYSLSNQR